SHAFRRSRHDRGGSLPQHARKLGPVAGRSAGGKAGQQHAGSAVIAGRPRRAGRLSGGADMSGEGLRDTDLTLPELEQQLDRVWHTPKTLWGWLTTVDHKLIGKRYIITALVFLVLGGLSALVMRLQLGSPDNTLVGPDTYNQLFTMHGSTMMFLFAVPVMETMA